MKKLLFKKLPVKLLALTTAVNLCAVPVSASADKITNFSQTFDGTAYTGSMTTKKAYKQPTNCDPAVNPNGSAKAYALTYDYYDWNDASKNILSSNTILYPNAEIYDGQFDENGNLAGHIDVGNGQYWDLKNVPFSMLKTENMSTSAWDPETQGYAFGSFIRLSMGEYGWGTDQTVQATKNYAEQPTNALVLAPPAVKEAGQGAAERKYNTSFYGVDNLDVYGKLVKVSTYVRMIDQGQSARLNMVMNSNMYNTANKQRVGGGTSYSTAYSDWARNTLNFLGLYGTDWTQKDVIIDGVVFKPTSSDGGDIYLGQDNETNGTKLGSYVSGKWYKVDYYFDATDTSTARHGVNIYEFENDNGNTVSKKLCSGTHAIEAIDWNNIGTGDAMMAAYRAHSTTNPEFLKDSGTGIQYARPYDGLKSDADYGFWISYTNEVGKATGYMFADNIEFKEIKEPVTMKITSADIKDGKVNVSVNVTNESLTQTAGVLHTAIYDSVTNKLLGYKRSDYTANNGTETVSDSFAFEESINGYKAAAFFWEADTNAPFCKEASREVSQAAE